MNLRTNWTSLATGVALFVASCVSAPPDEEPQVAAQVPEEASEPSEPNTAAPIFAERINDGAVTSEAEDALPVYEEFTGSGNFINIQAARSATPGETAEGTITLNFQDSDIVEVARLVLGDILGANYVIAPNVDGTVSMQTMRPIPREAVVPTFEVLLSSIGASLVRRDNVYMIVPEGQALANAGAPRIGRSPDQGFQMLVIPLRYVAADEMSQILEPIMPASGDLRVDTTRNLLIVAGSQADLQNIRDTVNIFDVDQFAGLSVGLYRLQYANPTAVIAELGELFGADANSPLAGMARFIVIERLNAILTVTPQRAYLDHAREWIERLDQAETTAGTNIFLYSVKNTEASYLAGLLGELITEPSGAGGEFSLGSGAMSPSPTLPDNSEGGAAESAPAAPSSFGTGALELGNVRVIADEQNNALLIMASRSDYEKIEAVLRKLDVLPLQVLVEATIVEVSLTEDLAYGLQWFFKNGSGDSDSRIGRLYPLTVDPSFSYTITDSAGAVRAMLNVLAAESKLNVLSSPSLIVLDNHTALIKVGDQVPIRTSETTSLATSGTDPLITSTIQYRDTGVLLEVTPRVNPGGMVILNVSQDVNDVDQTTTSAIDSPTIIQRQINTEVAVQSGETVVLGGLIKENSSDSRSGFPGLRRVPGLRWLFGSQVRNTTRTELLVLITPTAIEDTNAAREVTNEMKQKMPALVF